MTGAVWYTSDTHFRHTSVAKLRGFETAGEHDDEIVRRWNSVVRPDDIVWHLGDVGIGNCDPLLAQIDRLNGRKRLIAGNHDCVWPGHKDAWKHQAKWMQRFECVQAFAKRKLNGRYFLMSHFPYSGDHTENVRYPQYRLRNYGQTLLHGHTHSTTRFMRWEDCLEIHVGLDAWNLAPVNEGVIANLIGEWTSEYS